MNTLEIFQNGSMMIIGDVANELEFGIVSVTQITVKNREERRAIHLQTKQVRSFKGIEKET
jgi:hypothetical protein